jgi:hypothetical protein
MQKKSSNPTTQLVLLISKAKAKMKAKGKKKRMKAKAEMICEQVVESRKIREKKGNFSSSSKVKSSLV